MQTLAKQVSEHATGAPEGTPLVAKELLQLGSRAAVDQVLSRLVQRGALLRAGRGIYVLPVESRFGTRAQMVEFRHAPIWQLIFPGRAAGEVVRARAWLGPEKAGEAIQKLRAKLPPSELKEVVSARSRLPTWMAQEISALVAYD
ncbi:hypothetical protein RGU70_10690 [Herbaspirillum sp. RTI4]|uniref:hypothetical protein n=1 Tax=Herbaspirillum sp. RTI4 TaxID=3048640 RepID=UPI002AB54F31|nr:hypothetical protein [Herbaspirillum sp. RTI4]MDY7578786.1 hypothetical protein [Herbaspirillum sp. RTI4]